MATLVAGTNANVVVQSGSADRMVLIAVRNVNTGDTLDVGSSGMGVMQFINRAVCISVTSFVEIAVSFTGTVLTMPSGLTNDAGYVLLWGSGLN